MILEIIRNALAFDLMLSDCLHSTIFSTCRQILISSRPIHYECFLFTHLATCTCTILFQTRANQLIWSSQCLLTCLSLFGTKIGANTSTLHWETYLYNNFAFWSTDEPQALQNITSSRQGTLHKKWRFPSEQCSTVTLRTISNANNKCK